MLPLLQRTLQLDTGELDDVADRALSTDEGHLIDLGEDVRAAVARIDVQGAASGVLYLEAPAASPDQMHNIAEPGLGDLIPRVS